MAPGGEAAYYVYDPLNRPSGLQADAFGVDAVTYYAYDEVGNRTRVSHAPPNQSVVSPEP